MFDKSNFADSYLFNAKALATGTGAQVSTSKEIGNTQCGIRVRSWIDGVAVCGSGAAVVANVQVGDKADSTAATDWTDIAAGTATANATVTGTGTDATTAYSVSGDIVSYVPDTGKKFMRLSVSNSTGMTGAFSAALEYIPR